MKLPNKIRAGLKKSIETVNTATTDAINTLGEVVMSDTTKKVAGVVTEGASEAVFAPAEKIVTRISQVAEITGSPTIKVTHAVADALVTTTKDIVTSGVNALLGGAIQLSGEKLTSIGKPKDNGKE